MLLFGGTRPVETSVLLDLLRRRTGLWARSWRWWGLASSSFWWCQPFDGDTFILPFLPPPHCVQLLTVYSNEYSFRIWEIEFLPWVQRVIKKYTLERDRFRTMPRNISLRWLNTGAFSYEELSAIAFSFLRRWLWQFANNKRYQLAIIYEPHIEEVFMQLRGQTMWLLEFW